LVAVAVLAAAFAGCGGGSPSTSATTSAGQAATEPPTAASKPLPGHPKIATKPSHRHIGSEPESDRYGSFTRASAAAAERKAERRHRAIRRKLARRAGKAAPFLVKEGDNSIPTYGSEASARMRTEAERALSRYLQARTAEDWALACSLMSPGLERQLKVLTGGRGSASDCAPSYAALAQQGSAAALADPMVGGITALRVQRPHAFALFYGSDKRQYMMPLEDEQGYWVVTQLAPVPWPIGAAPS
jgi:hypothetical protein